MHFLLCSRCFIFIFFDEFQKENFNCSSGAVSMRCCQFAFALLPLLLLFVLLIFKRYDAQALNHNNH